jgi:hypothetical protein
MTDQEALTLPLSRRAKTALEQFGAKVSQPIFPPTDLLIWAIQHRMMVDQIKGAQAMMLDHLDQVVSPMADAEAAAYLFGEESELDPGEDREDVLQTLMDMLHLRMTETVEGYPPARTT